MSVRRDGYPPAMLAEVAEVCDQVHGVGPKPAAVAARFGIAPTTAHKLIVAARKAGYPIIKDVAKKYPPCRLVCGCGMWSAPIDAGVVALSRHTRSTHGRNPTMVERTPRAVRVAS